MLIINGKAMLRVAGQLYKPGERADFPDGIAEKLIKSGLVQKATKEPPEKAVMPEPKEITMSEIKQDYTVAELRQMLKDRDLPVYGTKAELIERLEGE